MCHQKDFVCANSSKSNQLFAWKLHFSWTHYTRPGFASKTRTVKTYRVLTGFFPMSFFHFFPVSTLVSSMVVAYLTHHINWGFWWYWPLINHNNSQLEAYLLWCIIIKDIRHSSQVCVCGNNASTWSRRQAKGCHFGIFEAQVICKVSILWQSTAG